jgi:hypothetical protein
MVIGSNSALTCLIRGENNFFIKSYKYKSRIDFSGQSIDNGLKGGIFEGGMGMRLPS